MDKSVSFNVKHKFVWMTPNFRTVVYTLSSWTTEKKTLSLKKRLLWRWNTISRVVLFIRFISCSAITVIILADGHRQDSSRFSNGFHAWKTSAARERLLHKQFSSLKTRFPAGKTVATRVFQVFPECVAGTPPVSWSIVGRPIVFLPLLPSSRSHLSCSSVSPQLKPWTRCDLLSPL